jgi:hypothetical protein
MDEVAHRKASIMNDQHWYDQCKKADAEIERLQEKLAASDARISQQEPVGWSREQTIEEVLRLIQVVAGPRPREGREEPVWIVDGYELERRLIQLRSSPQPATAHRSDEAVAAEREACAKALDAAHYYIDAHDNELREAGITRDEALSRARDLRAAIRYRAPSTDQTTAHPQPSDREPGGWREALEPFALMSAEGVVKQEKGRVTITTQAEYFHRASAVLASLQPEPSQAERLRTALEPFAKEADAWPDHVWDGYRIGNAPSVTITVGDLRRAREALGDKPGETA